MVLETTDYITKHIVIIVSKIYIVNMAIRAQETAGQVRQPHMTAMIHEISLMIARIFNRRVKHVGLTRAQWQVLYLLYEDDGQTQTQIAEQLVMAKPPLGRVIDRLEEDGWVVRRDDANDRRAKRVFLTQKVSPLINPLEVLMDEIGDIACRNLSDAERNTFAELLRVAHRNLAAEADANHD